LQFPLGSDSEAPQTNAVVTESLIAPGNFEQAYGPLAGDTMLAFTANGEAHWFRLRHLDEA